MGQEKVILAIKEDLIEIAELYTKMYPKHTTMQMLEWVKSESYPYRQHYILVLKRKVIGAITWEVYDNYKEKLVAKIKWLFLKEESRGKDLGKKLILESFKQFNDSWERKVVSIRVAPYEDKSGLEKWYKKVLDQLPGPEAKITLIPDLFGKAQGEHVVVKRLK
jgi:hypothetical protein